MGFPAGTMMKNMPANTGKEMRVQSLGCKDPLEEGMATHSNTLAWRVPWTEEPDRLQSIGSHRLKGLKQLSMHAQYTYIPL